MAETNTGLPTIAAILCAAQQKLKTPKDKNGHNNRYKYRNLEDINQALKPILEEMGAAVTYDDTVEEINGHVYIRATCTLIGPDGETYATHALARESEARNRGMDDPQITGSASSYARKYAACGMFAVSGEKDPDELPPVETAPQIQYPDGEWYAQCKSCGQIYGPMTAYTAPVSYCETCHTNNWQPMPGWQPDPQPQQTEQAG